MEFNRSRTVALVLALVLLSATIALWCPALSSSRVARASQPSQEPVSSPAVQPSRSPSKGPSSEPPADLEPVTPPPEPMAIAPRPMPFTGGDTAAFMVVGLGLCAIGLVLLAHYGSRRSQ